MLSPHTHTQQQQQQQPQQQQHCSRVCIIMYLVKKCKRFFDRKTLIIIINVITVLEPAICPTLSGDDHDVFMSKGSFTLSKSEFFPSVFVAAQCKH